MPRWSPRARLLALALVAAGAAATPWGCGARTGLSVPTASPTETPLPSNAFCGKSTYASGFAGLSIYLLLDQSGSMAMDNKWDSVTAAIGAFVDDPLAAGIGMGMQYFPLWDECSDSAYATPAAPLQLLPSNAASIKASLAAHSPNGETPTVPALRGALEYARAAMSADPTREVIVVLATDGDPDDCSSDVAGVATVAADGVASHPQVLTAVIGIENADVKALDTMAAAGGMGAPIPIGMGPGAAQQFVNALRSIRDAAEQCRFAVPPTPGATPTETDVAVSYVSTPGTQPVTLPLVAGASGCDAGGFYVDDPKAPTAVVLCPGTCELAHQSAGSTVTVTAGCSAGSPPPGTPLPDGGMCGAAVTFECVSQCGSTDTPVLPVCVGGAWVCGEGLVSTDLCTQCQPVPHGCCKSDGTLGDASCVNGAWTCPPGAQLFGEGSCQPPAACAAMLPCPLSAYCQVPDGSCGLASLLGSCQPLPTSCPAGGPQVCGCDGQVHPSACAAAMAGFDVSAGGTCPTPAGTFACGPLFCEGGSQICVETNDLAKSPPKSFACAPAPPGCSTGCGCNLCPPCPAGQMCGESCTGGGSERFLTCNEI